MRQIRTNFYETFSLHGKPHKNRAKTVRTEDAIAAVNDSVTRDRHSSIRRRAQEMGLYPSTLCKIYLNLKKTPFKKTPFIYKCTRNTHKAKLDQTK